MDIVRHFDMRDTANPHNSRRFLLSILLHGLPEERIQCSGVCIQVFAGLERV